MDDLISVIVPIYKAESYLKRCVDSIILQTYQNLEIILVDDGSPDQCPEICDDYLKVDTRIKVIHKQNGGVSSARNAGLKTASGNYIGFVDADDWIDPQMYEILYQTIIASKAQMSIISCIKEDEVSSETSNIAKFVFKEKQIEIIEPCEALRTMCLGTKFEGHMVTKLIERSLFEDISFPENITICEDMLVSTWLIIKAKRIAYYPFNGYHYLQRDDSALHQLVRDSDWSVQKACSQMHDIVELNYKEVLPFFDCVSMGQDLILAMRLNHSGLLDRNNINKLRRSICSRKNADSYKLLNRGSKIRIKAFFISKTCFSVCNWLLRNTRIMR